MIARAIDLRIFELLGKLFGPVIETKHDPEAFRILQLLLHAMVSTTTPQDAFRSEFY
jgi:hypothetical protein